MTISVEQFAHTRLDPFGLLVTASTSDADLRRIPPETLAGWTDEAKVVVLRGLPLLPTAEFESYCDSWGELLRWDFGAVLDLEVQEDPKNYLFTRGPVPFHWDGAFASAQPNYFLFQCLDARVGGGGETVFCDTVAAYAKASDEQRAAWDGVRITYRTDKLAHYGGDVTHPLVSTHPKSGETVLRYAEPLDPESYVNPLFLEVDGAPDGPSLVAELSEYLWRPEFCYAHAWLPGDIVVVENHALVHGRRPFVGDSSRHLQRVQII